MTARPYGELVEEPLTDAERAYCDQQARSGHELPPVAPKKRSTLSGPIRLRRPRPPTAVAPDRAVTVCVCSNSRRCPRCEQIATLFGDVIDKATRSNNEDVRNAGIVNQYRYGITLADVRAARERCHGKDGSARYQQFASRDKFARSGKKAA